MKIFSIFVTLALSSSLYAGEAIQDKVKQQRSNKSIESKNKTNGYVNYVSQALILNDMRWYLQAKHRIAGYYINTGKLPSSNKELGIPEPHEIRGGSLKSLTVSHGGVVTLTFDQRSGIENGTIQFVPNVKSSTTAMKWSCNTQSFHNIESWLSQCNYTSGLLFLVRDETEQPSMEVVPLPKVEKQRNSIQNGALHDAVSTGYFVKVKRLLRSGANVNALGTSDSFKDEKTSPLIIATYLKDTSSFSRKVIALLISSGANINYIDDYGRTALLGACITGHGFDAIMKTKVNPLVKVKGGETILAACAKAGGKRIGDLAAYAMINNPASKRVVEGAFLDLIDYCGKEYPKYTPLFSNRDDSTLTIWDWRQLESNFEKIMESGIDVNIKNSNGDPAIYLASKGCTEEVIKLFTKSDAYIDARNKKGETAVFAALLNNKSTYILRGLAWGGADFNIVNKKGETVLHILLHDLTISNGQIKNDRLEQLRRLLRHGVNPGLLMVDAQFPVDYAIQHNLTYAKEQLLKAGRRNESEEWVMSRGWPSPQLARIIRDDPDHAIVRIGKLLNVGANINVVNDAGVSPLSMACAKGDKKIFESLIQLGAKYNLRNSHGITPIKFCKRYKRGLVESLVALKNKQFKFMMSNNGKFNGIWWQKKGDRISKVFKMSDGYFTFPKSAYKYNRKWSRHYPYKSVKANYNTHIQFEHKNKTYNPIIELQDSNTLSLTFSKEEGNPWSQGEDRLIYKKAPNSVKDKHYLGLWTNNKTGVNERRLRVLEDGTAQILLTEAEDDFCWTSSVNASLKIMSCKGSPSQQDVFKGITLMPLPVKELIIVEKDKRKSVWYKMGTKELHWVN